MSSNSLSYEELACELLGEEVLPLALPRWPEHEADPVHYSGGLTDRHEDELQYQVCRLTDMSPDDWPDLDESKRIVWMRLALDRKILDAESSVQGNPQDQLDDPELLNWIKTELKGKQRRVMELVVDGGGECPLSEIAIDEQVSWETPYDDTFNSIRRNVNTKLKKAGLTWRLERHDNKGRLAKVGQK